MGINIARVAKLARLDLAPEELQSYGQQLTEILGHVAALGERDAAGAEPMVHAVEQANVFRPDTRQRGQTQKLLNMQALSNAPDKADGFFVVPRVVE